MDGEGRSGGFKALRKLGGRGVPSFVPVPRGTGLAFARLQFSVPFPLGPQVLC